MTLRFVLFSAVACTALTLTACSSATPNTTTAPPSSAPATAAAVGNSDPVEWTGAFCEGITPTFEGLIKVMKSAFQEVPDPKAQKDALMEYSATAGAALSDTAKKLEKLGPPSKEAEALHRELVTYFTDNGKTLLAVQDDLKAIDPADPAFLEKVGALGDGGDQSKLQDQIKKLQDDPKLKEAFAKAPQCVDMAAKMKEMGTDLLGK